MPSAPQRAQVALGFGLDQHQKAMTAARATAEASLRASLSWRVAMRRKSLRRLRVAAMRHRSRQRCLSWRILRLRPRYLFVAVRCCGLL